MHPLRIGKDRSDTKIALTSPSACVSYSGRLRLQVKAMFTFAAKTQGRTYVDDGRLTNHYLPSNIDSERDLLSLYTNSFFMVDHVESPSVRKIRTKLEESENLVV